MVRDSLWCSAVPVEKLCFSVLLFLRVSPGRLPGVYLDGSQSGSPVVTWLPEAGRELHGLDSSPTSAGSRWTVRPGQPQVCCAAWGPANAAGDNGWGRGGLLLRKTRCREGAQVAPEHLGGGPVLHEFLLGPGGRSAAPSTALGAAGASCPKCRPLKATALSEVRGASSPFPGFGQAPAAPGTFGGVFPFARPGPYFWQSSHSAAGSGPEVGRRCRP